ncbi:MAG: bifunctional 4-hydroxy-2-oxoglutarate aldolase/2-dehydro-3-deoxy-phosphogluconate aldolase [Propionibacteriaceae bacterium]|jgi:2-dehydro-3-deoxyphosphogluconate aldolase/(4S)-4-hydroxy-2-oxoglutarate aldolase|nr:bifunctional 4-hydroxy-2-oxoglutarate aldolase/2-dehydro-3-deoxy-phosphogluconate aldolase [Propionibacteriaceae bacterium]
MPDPESILTRVRAHGIVPVVVLDRAEQALGLAQALIDGGLPLAEVTFRTAAAPAAIAALAERGDLTVGAGTVLTPQQVDQAAQAGARFIVSPGLSQAVVARCGELGLLCLPGAITPTEVQAGLELGLSTLKFFPAASAGGPAALAALGGPFRQVAFVPTGGVGLADLADYLTLPNVAAVGGSWMVPRAALAAGDFDRVRQLTAEAVQTAASVLGRKSAAADQAGPAPGCHAEPSAPDHGLGGN